MCVCVSIHLSQDGISCLNIVEKYDPVKNKWQRIAPMSARRLGVAVAVVNDVLYAVGGSDGTSPLYTVEKYRLAVGLPLIVCM